ncbi:MAG: GtrA family protein, partial [Verrucomicrobiota bacterium]
PTIHPLQTTAPTSPSLPLQFLKYALCGGTAFCFHQLVVYSLGYTINPAFDPSLGDELRFQRSALNNTLAFLVSNTVAYLLNIRFVFQSGRHSRKKEIALFFFAAALSFFPALFALDLIIRTYSLNTHFANIVFATTAASANFFIRKFLIFAK